MGKLEELALARSEAQKAYDDFARSIETEAREVAAKAKAEVEARHKDRRAELFAARTEAHKAWQTEVDATASHEWEGKKVSRQKNVGRGYHPRYETIYGVVEVRRSTTAFPDNQKYGLPGMGQPFVRLLTKSGKPGKMIDASRRMDSWKLAE